MAHVRSGWLVHEGRIGSIGFGQSYLVWNVGVYSLISCRLGCEGRIVLLHHLLLHSYSSFLFISFLISDHFQVLYLCFRSWGEALLHSFLGSFVSHFQFFPIVLIFDYISLAHGQFWDGSLHFPGEFSKSALKFIDFFWDFECGLPSFCGIFF